MCVRKYKLTWNETQKVEIPGGFEILSAVVDDDGLPALFVMVYTDRFEKIITFRIVGTCVPILSSVKFIATVVEKKINNLSRAWHIFEEC